MKKLKKKIILISLLAIASVGVFFGTRMELGNKQEAIVAATQQLNASSSYLLSESLLERQANETKEKRATLETYFITTEGVVSFLEAIEALGKTAGISVVVDTVAEETRPLPGMKDQKDPKKVGTYGTITFTVSFEGTWQGVYRFLSLLEHVPYASTLERVSFDYAPEGKGVEGSDTKNTSNNNNSSPWKGVAVFTVAKL